MVKFLWAFTRRQTWGVADFLALFVLLPLTTIWLVSPLLWPARSWIYLHSVEVHDTTVGEDILINVDRQIFRSTTHGSYRVTVRSYPNLQLQCSSGGYVEVPYDSEATVDPEELLTLSWWAWGPNGDCEDWTPQPGQYTVDTEHCWRRFSITRSACRVVRSNVFTIKEVPDER